MYYHKYSSHDRIDLKVKKIYINRKTSYETYFRYFFFCSNKASTKLMIVNMATESVNYLCIVNVELVCRVRWEK